MKNVALSILAGLVVVSTAAWITEPAVQGAFDAFTWFLLPGLAVVIVFGSTYFSSRLKRHQRWISMPDKKAFLALSDERKEFVYRHMRSLFAWLSLEVSLLMTLIQFGIYEGIQGEEFNAYIIVGLAFAMIVSPTVAFVFVGKIQSEVKRQLREQEKQEIAGRG